MRMLIVAILLLIVRINAAVISPAIELNQLSPDQWIANDASKLKIIIKDNNGKFSLQLSQGEISQKCQHLENNTNSRRTHQNGIVDTFYKVSAGVKGEGKIQAGVETIAVNGSRINWEGYLSLNGKEQEFTLSGQEKNPLTIRHRVIFRLAADSHCEITDPQMYYYQSPANSLEVMPADAVAVPGEEIKINLNLKKPSPVAVRNYSNIEGTQLISEETFQHGPIILKVPVDAKSDYRITISVPEYGISKLFFVQIVTKEQYDILNKTAGQIKLQSPLEVLVIGDSLTDFARGFNYLDIVDFFVNINGRKMNFRNYGVGGEYTTRVWKRIVALNGNGNPPVRQEMYRNLTAEKVNEVWIALGSNDTRVSRKTDFKIPQVPRQEQEETVRKIVNSFRRQNSKVRIVFIACPSHDFSSIESRFKANPKSEVLFGVDDEIKHFNSVLKKVAAETDADYIDFYQATKDFTEKSKLFRPGDGVHLTSCGQQLLALEILKYLTNRK